MGAAVSLEEGLTVRAWAQKHGRFFLPLPRPATAVWEGTGGHRPRLVPGLVGGLAAGRYARPTPPPQRRHPAHGGGQGVVQGNDLGKRITTQRTGWDALHTAQQYLLRSAPGP
ncbi:hypothetical protein GCM10010278_73510 [Streptomyces melanogenes]|nr:hypothetical protein GCM10010278_73510 [Streptomyces melanogenes]